MSPRLRLALLIVAAAACGLLVYVLGRSTDPQERQPPRRRPRQGPARRVTKRPTLTIPRTAYQDPAQPGGEVVVSGGWGSGPGQFGRREARESNPEGPMSLQVGRDGELWVLDQVNKRLQRFGADGKLKGAVPIDTPTAQDVAIDDQGRAHVLDRLGQRPGVQLYAADGRPGQHLRVVGGKIEEGGGITGLFVTAGGVYVEDGHDDLVRVSDGDGQQTDLQETIPGRPTRDGKLFIKAGVIDKAAGRVFVQAHDASKQLAWELPLNLTRPVLHLLLLDSDLKGRVYLGAEVGVEDAVTHELGELATLVVQIDAQGKLTGTLTLPPTTADAAETFRPLVVGDDGTIYHMVVTAQGLQITKYTF